LPLSTWDWTFRYSNYIGTGVLTVFKRMKKQISLQRDPKLSHAGRVTKWGYRAYIGAVISDA